MRKKLALGWLPDYPDVRDYTARHPKIQPLLQKAQVAELDKIQVPASVDLRQWCSPIEDQGNLGSCTAQAGVALVEYFQRRASGKHLDASTRFLYKATRNLMHVTGDTGATLKLAMGALVLFGVPPEDYWPYTEGLDFDEEPPAFCYAFAQNYQALNYYRLDPPGTPKPELLQRIKANLAAGLPAMFGFSVYDSIFQSNNTGHIPYPMIGEQTMGGHAVVAVGYDDHKVVKNLYSHGEELEGAILIRNSWGVGWGEEGYGWLPYQYVLQGLAVDWWSLLKAEWIETQQFMLEGFEG